jgi:DNA invertase Pin-like site-specific DNA recombinase
MTTTIEGSGRTVAYLRTASSDQLDSKRGLDTQRWACEGYARSVGLRITRIYADMGISGLSEQRPALTELMHDLSRGGIRRVLIADPARLARSRQLAEKLSERIRRNGASLAKPGDSRSN